jgi:ABC-type transport system substrate-binding protein/class 3 adenylate cyclase
MTDLALGSSLAGYRLERHIGTGGMGSVYLATELALERRVALKVIRPELAGDDRFRRRFLLECKLAAQLEHPAILPVHSAGEVAGRLFIAMRYVASGSLDHRLQRDEGPLPPAETLTLLAPIADAAHAAGLIHRDVKPGNILLEGSRAFLCDFGLARRAESTDSFSREDGLAVSGTLGYVAPEQLEGDTVDGRTDQYALACVLFQCLAGQQPFPRDVELAVVYAHLSEPPPSLSVLNPELPQSIDEAIERGLAKRREDRFATCTELLATAAAALGTRTARPADGRRVAAARLVTVLVVDLVDTTAHAGQPADVRSKEAPERYHATVHTLIKRYGGDEQDADEDGLLALFDEPAAAVDCGLALTQNVAPLGVEIRIGIHAGRVEVSGPRPVGLAPHVAARVAAAAAPAEVLVTAAVRDQLDDTEHRLEDRGTARLQGLDEPGHLYTVVAPDMTQAGRKLTSRSQPHRPRRGRWSRRRGIILGTVAAAVVAATVATGIYVTNRNGPAPSRQSAQTVGVYDAATLRRSSTVPTEPGSVQPVVAGDQTLLVSRDTQSVIRVDPKPGQAPRFTLPAFDAIAYADGTLWLGGQNRPTVTPVDVETGQPGEPITLARSELEANGKTDPDLDPQAGVDSLATDGKRLWATMNANAHFQQALLTIDLATRRQVGRAPIESSAGALTLAYGDLALAYGDGQLWAADRNEGVVVRLDPATGSVLARVNLRGQLTDLAAGGGYAWVASQNEQGVYPVDAGGGVLPIVRTGELPWRLSFGGGQVWVSNRNSGTVTAIDASSFTTRTLRLGARPTYAVERADGGLFVAADQGLPHLYAGLDRRKTITVLSQGDYFFGALDPAALGIEPDLGLWHAIGLGLVRMTDEESPRLVADGADLPAISPDGRTYTFHIRPGYRFPPPSNEQVTAETWRHTLERALSPKLGFGKDDETGFYYLADVVGARSYADGKSDHVTGIAAGGDTLTITLQAPAGNFLARLAMPYFSAVPLDTPVQEHGIRPSDYLVPSAGPFYLDGYVDGYGFVIKRNPNYFGERAAKVEAVVYRINWAGELALAEIDKGTADGLILTEPRDLPTALAVGGILATEYGAGPDPRWLPGHDSRVYFLQMNATHGPLRDLNLRKAICLALNRSQLARAYPTLPYDSLVGPGMPGYSSHTVSTTTDAAAARRLIAGRRIELTLVYGSAYGNNYEPDRVVPMIKDQLAAVGITLRLVPGSIPRRDAVKINADLLLNRWWQDYIDTGSTVGAIVDPASLGPYRVYMPDWLKDPAFKARWAHLRLLTGDQRGQAAANLLREVQQKDYPVFVIGIETTPVLRSPRLHCLQFSNFGPAYPSACLKD